MQHTFRPIRHATVTQREMDRRVQRRIAGDSEWEWKPTPSHALDGTPDAGSHDSRRALLEGWQRPGGGGRGACRVVCETANASPPRYGDMDTSGMPLPVSGLRRWHFPASPRRRLRDR